MKKNVLRTLCLALSLTLIMGMCVFSVSAADSYLPRVNIHLIGDSTVCNYTSSSDKAGWGQALEASLDSRAIVTNWAISGASTNSFVTGHWTDTTKTAKEYGPKWNTIKKQLKAGDYLFIQLGHNDQDINSEDEGEKANATDETAYKENLTKMVSEAKTIGAIPVLVTPPERKSYKDSGETLGKYPTYMKDVATAQGVACIDLNTSSKTYYATADLDAAFYDGTHFKEAGAMEMANLIINDADFPAALDAYVLAEPVEIFRPKTYLNEDFEDAAGTKTANTPDADWHVGENIGVADTAANTTTDFETDANGKYLVSTVNPAINKDSLYGNGGWTYFYDDSFDSRLSFLEFNMKTPEYTENNTTSEAEMIYRQGYALNLAYFSIKTDSSDNLTITAKTVDDSGTDRTLSFTNVLPGRKAGEWINVQLILDEYENKYHLIIDGILVATDIPFYRDTNPAFTDPSNEDHEEKLYNERTFYFRILNEHATNLHEFMLDDIKLVSVTERKAAALLMNGADGAAQREYVQQTLNQAKGYTSVKMPHTAKLSSDTQTLDWGSARAALSNPLYFAWNNDYDTRYNSASTTAPYRLAYLYPPNAYSTSYPDYDGKTKDTSFKTTVKINGRTFTDFSDGLLVKRRLLPSTDETIEIGLPRMFEVFEYCANLTDVTTKVSLSKIKTSGGWSGTSIKNIGTEQRKILAVRASYSASGLIYPKAYTITLDPGQVKNVDWGTVNSSNMNTYVPSSTTKVVFMFFDAKTLKPLSKAITLE